MLAPACSSRRFFGRPIGDVFRGAGAVLVFALVWLPGAVRAAPVIDGILSPSEWSGYEITTGSANVVPGVYELSEVYAYADPDSLYLGFQARGVSTAGGVLAMNVGLDRPLTTSPTATLGEGGAWGFAMELFNATSGAFATSDAKYKYNDAGVDFAGSPQTRDQPAADLVGLGQFAEGHPRTRLIG